VIHRIDWQNSYDVGRQGLWHEMFWRDNEHLLYENSFQDDILINPFTEEVTPYEAFTVPNWSFPRYSPDWTRAIFDPNGSRGELWTLTNGESLVELGIHDFRAAWHPDSSMFAAYRPLSPQRLLESSYQLNLYDSDSHLLETLVEFNSGTSRGAKAWSNDGHALAFFADRLYVANVDNREIVDTCLEIGSQDLVWSPNSQQIALKQFAYGQQYPIYIFDLETWQLYTIAYHTGNIIGWRASANE
jgi:hypothetical protein